ncbi:MAG TPA: signal peptidase I [Thermoanaerobaculia bacterium]|nr:signal peptidase I [Thermoanaerobaculia bacterium]
MTHKSAVRLVMEPIAIAIVLALGVRTALRLYVIPSSSMAPTLVPGDHIVVTPYRFSARPLPGDVIVFHSTRKDELLIKRVIGVPGDLVETRAGRVIVSGHALPEPYLAAQAATGSISPQIIPADCYYVLGDNRADSLDSRSWGVLPRDLVVGKARMILWSSDTGAGSREPGVVAASRSPSPDPRLQTPGRWRGVRLFRRIQ